MSDSYENILRSASYSTNNPEESLCKMRWDQPTIDLFSGQVRVCCRVPPLPISQNELQSKKTDAILNSDTLIQRRLEMFQGVKHVDCAPCWKAEASGQPSPRVGAEEILKKLKKNDASFEISDSFSNLDKSHPILKSETPSFLEIQMGNLCDLKCIYCWRGNSSKWAQEDLEFGKITQLEFDSLYKKAPESFEVVFWEWLETVAPHLQMISFVGGEPTLQKQFPEILKKAHEICKRQKNSEVKIRIVSNLNCSEQVFSRFSKVISDLDSESRSVLIDISMEAFGNRAEFIRYGLDWKKFDTNLDRLLGAKYKNVQVAISATINALSITSFKDFIHYLGKKQVLFETSIPFIENSVIDPIWLAPEIVPVSFKYYLDEASEELEKVSFNSSFQWGYGWRRYAEYVRKIANTIRFPITTEDNNIKWIRQRFHRGILELEKRRNVDFSRTFPEMKDFFNSLYN